MNVNPDAERAVLGAVLLGAPVVDDLAAKLQGPDFYEPRHERVWDACLAVHRSGARVDPLLVARALGADLARVGGAPALLALSEACLTPASAPHYAEQVLDAALRRRIADAARQALQLAESAEDAQQAAEDARRAMDDAARHARTADAGTALGDGLDAAVDWLENPPLGAETPWLDVNERTNGLLDGSMVVVAARPGHGKSLCLKELAVHTARLGRPVHLATLEMSRNEYMARILAGLKRIDLARMLRRTMSDNDWRKVGEAMDIARGLPLWLDDRENQSMAQIRAAARQTMRRYGSLALIGIDYAQLVRPADRRLPREQQVAQITRDTKLMAKEFACPVVLLAQLNRANQQRSDHTPQLSDLRESGSLEQDADQVWLLHRPDQYGDEGRLGEVDLIVAKNRNGPAPLTVPLAFLGHNAMLASLV